MNNSKIKKIALCLAVSLLSLTATADEAAFIEMIKLNSAQNGAEIIEHPRLKPDSKIYYFEVEVKKLQEKNIFGPQFFGYSGGEPVFLQLNYPALFNDSRRAKLKNYFKDLFDTTMDNMVFNKKYQVVGVYTDNKDFLATPAPVFSVAYIDTKRGPFKQAINLFEPEPPVIEEPTAVPNEQGKQPTDVCKQAFEEGNMAGMTECTQAELEKEDKRLNAEYKAVMSKLNAAQKKELRTKQRAWIKARDKDCKLEEDSGSAGLLNHVSCLNEWTKKRADELASMK